MTGHLIICTGSLGYDMYETMFKVRSWSWCRQSLGRNHAEAWHDTPWSL